MIETFENTENLKENTNTNTNTNEQHGVENTIDDLLGGIRSTCTYVNAHTLKDLPKCTTFFRVNNQVNRIYG